MSRSKLNHSVNLNVSCCAENNLTIFSSLFPCANCNHRTRSLYEHSISIGNNIFAQRKIANLNFIDSECAHHNRIKIDMHNCKRFKIVCLHEIKCLSRLSSGIRLSYGRSLNKTYGHQSLLKSVLMDGHGTRRTVVGKA